MRYLSLRELAEILGVSYRTVWNWHRRGIAPDGWSFIRLPSGRIRARPVPSDAQAFLDRLREQLALAPPDGIVEIQIPTHIWQQNPQQRFWWNLLAVIAERARIRLVPPEDASHL